jgi:hypothetical protein
MDTGKPLSHLTNLLLNLILDIRICESNLSSNSSRSIDTPSLPTGEKSRDSYTSGSKMREKISPSGNSEEILSKISLILTISLIYMIL